MKGLTKTQLAYLATITDEKRRALILSLMLKANALKDDE